MLKILLDFQILRPRTLSNIISNCFQGKFSIIRMEYTVAYILLFMHLNLSKL
jgi:hypothetical protein